MNKEEKEAEKRALLKDTGALWNRYFEQYDPTDNADDLMKVRTAIHDIQQVLYTQLYIVKHGKV